MGTQGPGRKRHPNREKLSAEDHALNQIAREAEARLAAKRAARAEAREIRMKELERQQKEIYQVQKKYYGLDTKWGDIEQWMEDSERYSHKPRRNLQASDEDDVMSVTSRSSLRTNGYEDELLGAAQYRKSSRSAYYSDLSLASAPLTAKSLQQSVHNGSRPSLLNCNSLPSRSQRGSLYDEGVTSGSRRSSSSRPPSEYSCYLGSGSRASSRASSARASPVSSEPTGPPLFRRGSASGSVHSQSHLEDVSVTSGSRIEERPDKDFAEKSGRPASSLSAATLASLGGTSSRRGSGDTSISVDTEASIREIKEISELKEQIEDVEGKYMQGLKEMKDSLAEVEEKYKRSMVTNAQLDNEKTSLQYQVDTLREVLLEMEEELAESRRQYEDKQKECERQKHEQGVLRFQLAEMKEALEQREALLTEIRQLQQKQEISDREICDLKETIEWKDKKIGALERQKEFFDPVRTERDALREEVTHLREALKKNGIALDSDSTLNGDASIEHHVNSDGPPDPPVRAVSMGKPEGTVERKEAMSMVGESPPRTEQDRQEIAQDAEKEMSLHAEGEDVSHKHNEEENNSGTSVESKSVEVCSHHKSETSMEEQKEELGSEEDKEMSGSEVVENISEVDGENTVKRSDVSPSGSEVFQDAIDFVETPSTINEVDEDVTSVSDPLKEEPKVNQPETVAKADDQCTMGGAPEEGAETTNENTANICENNESNILEGEQDSNNSSSSQEDISTETSEYTSSNENIALEQEVPVVEELKPLQSQEPESGSETIKENMGQSKNDGISSAAENTGDDDDQSKLVSADEKPSPDALITSDDLAAQVGKEETSDVSESSAVTERKSITEDESIKDHVIPEDSCSQDEQEPVQEDERQGDVLKGEELKVVDQREEDTLSGDLVSGNIKNETNTVADKAESPKESVPPETFSSEGESTQEDEETDDDDGTVRSEKYTGESEIPHASLGSSVDGQSLEDIRMEDGSEKSPRRGKGKNKEDCVLS
ncbi:leucine-rich repeat flightless-interacting protein 2-like isoform X3 [Dendropsophus ebraccatus]|uniref:leucine-rich repeat flightless-interacting protein 2-like isoform X3 n=1 Tax=Dendropsophus ebraccatus TaxID=150705 RepID=UPI0038318340